jgi:hypothetical protein
MVRRYVRHEQPWAYYINCVLWSNACAIRGFESIVFMTLMQPLVGVAHSRLELIVPLMLCTVCYAMAGALM